MAKRFKSVGKSQLLSHAVVEAIEGSIRSGHLVPGMKLSSELELCEQFGVSRTVLREALRVLTGRGLVRIEKGRGIFVSRLSSETVTTPMEMYLLQHIGASQSLDIIRARQLIEPPIAAEAAIHHSPADAERLRQNLRDIKNCGAGSEALAALDLAFHRHIAEASGNSVVPLLIEPIHALMPQVKSSVHKVVEDARYSAIVWHERILDAILKRDADGARSCMEQHLKEGEKHVMQMLAVRSGQEAAEEVS